MGHAKQKSLIFCSVQSSAQEEKSAIGLRISGSMQNKLSSSLGVILHLE